MSEGVSHEASLPGPGFLTLVFGAPGRGQQDRAFGEALYYALWILIIYCLLARWRIHGSIVMVICHIDREQIGALGEARDGWRRRFEATLKRLSCPSLCLRVPASGKIPSLGVDQKKACEGFFFVMHAESRQLQFLEGGACKRALHLTLAVTLLFIGLWGGEGSREKRRMVMNETVMNAFQS